jgi:NADH-quinone oxidoreductase subunit M
LHTRDLLATAGMGKFMPIFAMFAGVFALSSLAFPGTNSFIGEFMVMSAGFLLSKTNPRAIIIMICVVPGVVLAAAYMLRMLQKVAYGGTRNPDHSGLHDLGLREILTLAPLLVFVFWIGLKPQPFTRVLHVSVANLVQQVERSPAAMAETSPTRGGTVTPAVPTTKPLVVTATASGAATIAPNTPLTRND